MSRKISADHCLSELKTKERLLSSIHKISSLLTRPISLDKILDFNRQRDRPGLRLHPGRHLPH